MEIYEESYLSFFTDLLQEGFNANYLRTVEVFLWGIPFTIEVLTH